MPPNPYPQPFLERYNERSSTDIVVDIGSGGRAMPDLISMEWVDWPDNTLRGDCLSLPFRSDSVDLILSQAVLEHVTNPDLAVHEMFRVLRPGGVLYVEIAFMQPVHMPPWHYFNVTPHGLTWLLRDWEILEQGTLGSLQMVFDWFCKEMGVPKIPRVNSRVRHPEQYPAVAYGVCATARKPV